MRASCVSRRARSEGEPRHGAFGGCMYSIAGSGISETGKGSEGENIGKPQKLWKLIKRSGKGLMTKGCIGCREAICMESL